MVAQGLAFDVAPGETLQFCRALADLAACHWDMEAHRVGCLASDCTERMGHLQQ